MSKREEAVYQHELSNRQVYIYNCFDLVLSNADDCDILGHPCIADYCIDVFDLENARAQREIQNRQCGILRLPTELRIQIYKNVFAALSGLHFSTIINTKERAVRKALRESKGLLQTCRALRTEAQDVFWSSYVVEFGLPHGIDARKELEFLNTITQSDVASFRKIVIRTHWFTKCFPKVPTYAMLMISRDAEGIVVRGDFQSNPHGGCDTQSWANCKVCTTAWRRKVFPWIRDIEAAELHKKSRTMRKQDLKKVLRKVACQWNAQWPFDDWDREQGWIWWAVQVVCLCLGWVGVFFYYLIYVVGEVMLCLLCCLIQMREHSPLTII